MTRLRSGLRNANSITPQHFTDFTFCAYTAILGLSEIDFTMDPTNKPFVDQTTKEEILKLIAAAEFAYEDALTEENYREKGYAHTAGYSRQTLQCIKRMMESL